MLLLCSLAGFGLMYGGGLDDIRAFVFEGVAGGELVELFKTSGTLESGSNTPDCSIAADVCVLVGAGERRTRQVAARSSLILLQIIDIHTHPMLQPRIARAKLTLQSCKCTCLRAPIQRDFHHFRPSQSSSSATSSTPPASKARVILRQDIVQVDDYGIPIKPSYSVNAFLDSLPSPAISDEQYMHLHKLAALRPPELGTAEFSEKKQALEAMVRLVEGVREGKHRERMQKEGGIPDGRPRPHNDAIPLDWDKVEKDQLERRKRKEQPAQSEDDQPKYLHLASKRVAGYYVAPRPKQSGPNLE